MKKKYNNKSIYFKNWTTQYLKKEAKELDYQIHEVCCYGVGDLLELMGIYDELGNRGHYSKE